MKALHLSAATLLLGLAHPSGALTIGSAQGAAWIGQPLNLVVPLSIESREASDGLCLEAEVRQGDSRIDDKRITLSLEPGSTPDTPRVHLRTTNAIVEPVVSVRLSAGCTFKSTRQYTLLADLPATPAVIAPAVRASAPAASGSARRAQADAFSDESAEGGAMRRSRPSSSASVAPPRTAPRKPAAASTPANPDAARDAALTRRQASAAPPVRRPQAPAKPATAQPKPPAAASAAAPAPAPAAPPVAAATEGVSRLQIEPLTPNTSLGAAATARGDAAATTGGATSAPLRPSAPVGAAPPAAGAGTAPAPGTTPAAATAGAGTSAVPSAALNPASAGAAVDAQAFEREADRMKEMGEVLASLRAQSAQTQRLLLEMRSELAQAQASRYRNPLVYVLLALTGVLLLVVLLLWRSLRQARQAQWWSEEQAEAMAAQRAHAPRSTRLPRRGLLDDGADAEDEDDDDDLPVLTEVDEAGPTHAPAPRRGALDAVGFDRTLERSVNAEELFDVQQKAEFFMSLGKHEQAIGVLRDHVSANPGTSALVYLDLLNILHALGRTEDYARQAREFEERFNAEVPPFDAFDRQGRGLDHYPSVLARISDLWPGAGTAELIEELVFRHPGVRGEVFDLLAYQELLLLHAVARDIADHPAHVFARAHGAHAAPHFVAGGPAPGAVGEDETVPMPYLPHVDRAAVPANMPEVDMDISALDRTAFQTLRAPVENLPPAPAPAPIDPHVIDFNPFDPDDDELKPGRFSIKR